MRQTRSSSGQLSKSKTPATRSGIKRKNGDENLPSTKQKKAARSTSANTTEKPKDSQSSSNIKLEESIFQKIKSVLRRTAIPDRLIGRSHERTKLIDFWTQHVLHNKPGCLYVSGMPGTGKTALLTEVMRTMKAETTRQSHKTRTALINCMSMKNPKHIYQSLLDDLATTRSFNEGGSNDIIQQAERLLLHSTQKTLHVVILDEIDSLITRDQDVLYKLFEWASIPSSRLVLIGIANALDLTDRLLPRLRAKNCEPVLLNFNPYRVDEITAIIKNRLEGIDLIQPTAIELCARKVAASMGDLRTALDVCRQATELAELDHKKGQKAVTVALNDTQKQQTPPPPPPPKVTVAHVMRVLNGVFGSSTQQKLKQLNLQQKVVLGVLLVLQRRQQQKRALTLGEFRDQYSGLLVGTSMTPVSRTELNDLVSLLETASIVSVGKHREERLRKVELQVQETEITDMIQSVPILKEWIEQVIQ
ncbi:MAG: P-loop containing nucleoside triphosphate hydrolase protein [Benjaminiella poitrasii]|nr:MAG: P-loop containing nucleoside triphosphate hydrolase protein [Benjaminiella poitrasii]